MKKVISFILMAVLLATLLTSCSVLYPAGYEMKTGVVTSVDYEGNDVYTTATVLVDKAGKVVMCRIDEIAVPQTKGQNIASKKALGDSYNMVEYGGAIAEWYVQIAAFERACAGKTKDEVLAIKTGGEELVGTCTIGVENYTLAVKNALESEGKKIEMSGEAVISSSLTATPAFESGYVVSFVAFTMVRGYTVASHTEFKEYTRT